MMRCKEVTGLLASDQVTAGGFMQRVSVALHLMMCKYCSRFKRQIQQLGSAARRIAKATDHEKAAPEGESLEARVLRRLSDKNLSEGL